MAATPPLPADQLAAAVTLDAEAQLRHQVTEALRSRGLLANIRAHLRAAVYVALTEEERKGPAGLHPDPEDTAAKRLRDGPVGVQAARMVLEFLEAYGLVHTRSVLLAEANLEASPAAELPLGLAVPKSTPGHSRLERLLSQPGVPGPEQVSSPEPSKAASSPPASGPPRAEEEAAETASETEAGEMPLPPRQLRPFLAPLPAVSVHAAPVVSPPPEMASAEEPESLSPPPSASSAELARPPPAQSAGATLDFSSESSDAASFSRSGELLNSGGVEIPWGGAPPGGAIEEVVPQSFARRSMLSPVNPPELSEPLGPLGTLPPLHGDDAAADSQSFDAVPERDATREEEGRKATAADGGDIFPGDSTGESVPDFELEESVSDLDEGDAEDGDYGDDFEED